MEEHVPNGITNNIGIFPFVKNNLVQIIYIWLKLYIHCIQTNLHNIYNFSILCTSNKFTQSVENEVNAKEPTETMFHIVPIHHKMVQTLTVIEYKAAQETLPIFQAKTTILFKLVFVYIVLLLSSTCNIYKQQGLATNSLYIPSSKRTWMHKMTSTLHIKKYKHAYNIGTHILKMDKIRINKIQRQTSSEDTSIHKQSK